jgi:hypothetical protein
LINTIQIIDNIHFVTSETFSKDVMPASRTKMCKDRPTRCNAGRKSPRVNASVIDAESVKDAI